MICSSRIDTNDYWYRQDIRGSVTNIVDVDDDVVKSYTYDAYGNTDSTGTFINSFAYTGAVIDTEIGLYYMNARYYDPETGRFISQDSYRGDAEAFWHLYAYCDGDPVNSTDSTGHAKQGFVLYNGADGFSKHAESEKNYLKMKYKLSYVSKLNITSARYFKDVWNRLSSVNYAVSLIFHGGPHAFSCGKGNKNNIASYNSVHKKNPHFKNPYCTTDKLKKKSSIKYLRLLICNAGHLNHKDDNLANAFKSRIGGEVWSCDGSVGFDIINGRYFPRLAYDQHSFYDYIPKGTKSRNPAGFYSYK